MIHIKNPIIKGFNPDPSIVRVNDTYYIANSTFEWFPGIQIHKSKDLVNWKLCAKPLDSIKYLDMKGIPDSCGVWAPCLSFHEGLFYLVYSNVKTFDGVWKDTPNYLITTDDIENGVWSDPVFLNSSGFDASMFHDKDGRKWYLTLIVDHRKGKFFGGIGIQEYDPTGKRLIGKMTNVWKGSDLGITEGPHLYNRNGYYYLLTAEGGTEYGHAISIARSRNILGPYELHPQNPVISSKDNPEAPLQKTGHGALVETQNNEWYLTFLCGRPLSQRGRCTLGRETGIEKVEWHDDDWLYLSRGGCVADLYVPAPVLPVHVWPKEAEIEDFNTRKWNIHLNSLRIPITDTWCSLKANPGNLRLFGKDSLCSIHEQSMIARRVQAFHVEVETSVEFEPETFQQMAGLVFYYNTMHMHYLHVTYFEETGLKLLQIISGDNGKFTEPLDEPVDISGNSKVFLKGIMMGGKLQFYWSTDSNSWQKVGPELDASILSDDYISTHGLHYRAAFTGCFAGMCCQDLSGNMKHADFDYFKYKELDKE